MRIITYIYFKNINYHFQLHNNEVKFNVIKKKLIIPVSAIKCYEGKIIFSIRAWGYLNTAVPSLMVNCRAHLIFSSFCFTVFLIKKTMGGQNSCGPLNWTKTKRFSTHCIAARYYFFGKNHFHTQSCSLTILASIYRNRRTILNKCLQLSLINCYIILHYIKSYIMY